MIGSQDAPTLAGFVRNMVSDKVSLVVTDENQEVDVMFLMRSIVMRTRDGRWWDAGPRRRGGPCPPQGLCIIGGESLARARRRLYDLEPL